MAQVPSAVAQTTAASAAAAAVLPVPAVLDRAEVGDMSAVHALLADVRAPAGLRTVPGAGVPTPAGQARVVHLDLHPFNILTGAGGEVTGYWTGLTPQRATRTWTGHEPGRS